MENKTSYIKKFGLDEFISETDDKDLWELVLKECWNDTKLTGYTCIYIIKEIEDKIIPKSEIQFIVKKLEHTKLLLEENLNKSKQVKKLINELDKNDNVYSSLLLELRNSIRDLRLEILNNDGIVENYFKSLYKTMPIIKLNKKINEQFQIVNDDGRYKAIRKNLTKNPYWLSRLDSKSYIAFEQNSKRKDSVFVFCGDFPGPKMGQEVAIHYIKKNKKWVEKQSFITCVS